MFHPRGQGMKVLYLLGLALFSIRAECVPLGIRRGLIATGETVFDVTKDGAVANAKKDSTMAFMKTWNKACHSTEPARVLVPKGTFLTGGTIFQGPCTAPKPITIEIQGTVLGSTDLSVYENGGWIEISHVDGIVLTGGGTLNGQGDASWKYKTKGYGSGPGELLPDSLVWQTVTNAIMQNISLLNSKGFHMKVTDSTNITISDLHISAPVDSPNTDGIHISDSRTITVTNCVIGTGDDCISVGDGNIGVNISKIFCGPGHGISIGSLGKHQGETDVEGITITNCTLTGTTNGVRIKTWRDSPALKASHILFDDIIMDQVKNPIIIDQNYNSKNRKMPSKVKISDVHFKNIRGTTISNVPVTLNCSETVPCEGIELVDINLTPATKDVGPLSSFCTNAKFLVNGQLNPAGCRKIKST